MTIIKKATHNKCGEDVKLKKPQYTVGGNENWCSHYGKQYRGSLKNEKND